MKAKWISILATAITSYLIFLPLIGQAQWSVGFEYNIAFPIGGYEEVFKTGSNINLDGKYHLNKGWGIGFQTGAAIFANSKEGPFAFAARDPKLTVVPLIFTGEYEANHEGMIRPFFAAALGWSIYTFSYYLGNHYHYTSETKTSFTMSPQIGVRFFITKNTMSYLKGSYVFVMDVPPLLSYPNLPSIIFPVSDEEIGYAGIALGFSYRFNR